MPRTCTVCRHSERAQIDNALVSGTGTFRSLASRFGLSASSVRRHRRDHLPDTLVRAHAAKEIADAESLADQARALRARTLRLLAKAEADGDTENELAAIRELRALAELEHRGTMHNDATVPIAVVQEYVQHVIRVVREFVPRDRVDAVIAKIEGSVPEESATLPAKRTR
jgi:transposase-like protein